MGSTVGNSASQLKSRPICLARAGERMREEKQFTAHHFCRDLAMFLSDCRHLVCQQSALQPENEGATHAQRQI